MGLWKDFTGEDHDEGKGGKVSGESKGRLGCGRLRSESSFSSSGGGE